MNSKRAFCLTLISVFALAMFSVSCATTTEKQTVSKLGNITINESIDWEKEMEAYNADPNNKIKYVCKEMTPTGSHIPRMTCQTTANIENRRRQDQRAIEDYLRGAK